MKKLIAPITACTLLVAHAPLTSAATDFQVINGSITDAANWSNGLPTGGNLGTITINAKIPTYQAPKNNNPAVGEIVDGFNITQTAGTVSRIGINSVSFLNSIYNLNGGTWSTRGVGVGANSVFTVNSGIFTTDSNRDSAVSGDGKFIFNGGNSTHGRHLYLQDGDIEINSGIVSINNDLGSRNFHTGGTLDLNGGTISATYLTFGKAAFDVHFGGTTSGSLTIDNFGGSRADVNNIGINFDAGSMMSLSLTNAVESGASGDGDLGWSEVGSETGLEWAEALWADGRLTYNSQSFAELGNWSAVEGSVFNFDSPSNTLSLVPEPGSLALLGLAGLCVLRRRRDA